MATIHDEIDNWLVADIHGELSEQERSALHTHLVEWGGCRKTHQETKSMNKILEETFTAEKPGPGFEQRMLADFRSRLPEKPGLVQLLTQVMRVRAVQITSVGAVLLGRVQIGRMITGENATAVRDREAYRKDKFIASPSEMAASHSAQAGALSKSDELATRSQDFALAKPQAPPAPPTTQSEFRDASSERAKTLAARKASAANTENFARAEEAQAKPGETPVPELANRKLIRNARVELEIVSFNNAIQKISAFANEERGYVATTDSQKQANGKLGSASAKTSHAGRAEESNTRHRGRDEGVFGHRCAVEECARDGAALDRYAENKNRQGVRFASGGKGIGSRA